MSIIEQVETAAWNSLLAQGVFANPETGDINGEVDMRLLVRSIIQAMRDPSEAMLRAGRQHMPGTENQTRQIDKIWSKMLRAALEEK